MKRSIVFTFGRFNPPSIGHALLMNTVRIVSTEQKCEGRIYMSKSYKDREKNPLTPDTKLYWVNTMFKTLMGDNVYFDFAVDAFEVLDKLNTVGYTDLYIVVGSDRVDEFKRLLNNFKRKYPNNCFKNVQFYCAGTRDPDSDDVCGISSTKLREYAKNGDFESFSKGTPKTIEKSDKVRFFQDVRIGLGIKEEHAILLESKFR